MHAELRLLRGAAPAATAAHDATTDCATGAVAATPSFAGPAADPSAATTRRPAASDASQPSVGAPETAV